MPPDFDLLAEHLSGAGALDLEGVQRIDLQFPKFTDGRAYSQAVLLRRRLGYRGLLRATGEVLIDQLLQLQRCGFDEALLRADQSLAHGQRLLQQFDSFYQGDAQQPLPRFAAALTPTATGAHP
ncbi:MAG: hypothetical protein JM57_06605 [Comamonadaceae bacterium BICA1-1]|nr:MAG: hypothetical protein JM57_06605 [Comamonadaceae bacterium BICA1-1]